MMTMTDYDYLILCHNIAMMILNVSKQSIFVFNFDVMSGWDDDNDDSDIRFRKDKLVHSIDCVGVIRVKFV